MLTAGHSAAIARASSSVSVNACPLPSRIPDVVMLPGTSMIRLLPRLAICCWMRAVAPAPTATVAITAATPMITPNIVSADRTLFVRKAVNAMFTLGRIGVMKPPPPPSRR